jgi:cell division protein FtsB
VNARIVIAVLAVLLLGLQYRLWFGSNSVAKVSRFETQVAALRAGNEDLDGANAKLKAEVRELKSGHDTIEALARSELGMVRDGETFFFQPSSR